MSQQPESNLKPEVIISIILKRRWLIIVPFFIALVVGIYLSFTLPKKYEASTMIMVEAQKVPEDYVQSIVSEDITSRLNTIQEQVMSRTNIERIIDAYHLFEGPEYENMFFEDKVQRIRDDIGVNVGNSSKRNEEISTFSISYKGEEPENVKNIADALAGYVINRDLEDREATATNTSTFLEEQLASLEKELDKKDRELQEFQQKYEGELPGQYEANLSGLERSRAELLDQQQALRETNNALAALEQQIAESQKNAVANMAGDNEGETTDLATLRAQLEALRAHGYKEKHPSVIQLENTIRKLEEQAENIENESGDSQSTGSGIVTSGLTAAQENQLTTLELQKKNLEAEIEDLEKEVALFRKRIENTPKRQAELLSIQRNYDIIKNSYDTYYNKSIEAGISTDMVKKQKGEQYKIIDSARLPEKPISPDMKKLFMLAVAAGLGIGGGLTFLLEFMNKSFKTSDDAESFLGFPVLATIPSLQAPKDRVMSRINNILSIASVLISFLLLAGFAFITMKGTDAALGIVGRFM